MEIINHQDLKDRVYHLEHQLLWLKEKLYTIHVMAKDSLEVCPHLNYPAKKKLERIIEITKD